MKHLFGNGSKANAYQHKNGGGWVADTAYVDVTAFIGPNAQVFDDARVFARAKICDHAQVSDNAIIYANARVDGTTQICGRSLVYYTKHFVLLDIDNFKCYGPFSDPSEMLFTPGVSYRIIELE